MHLKARKQKQMRLQEVVAEEETVEEEGIDLNGKSKKMLTHFLLVKIFQKSSKRNKNNLWSLLSMQRSLISRINLMRNTRKLDNEQVEEIKLELTERTDAYLEYVADEWLKENALAVENGIKTEMTESFMEGMKKAFEEHYVTLPEDKYDVLENMVDKLDEMETKMPEIERNVALNQRLGESTAQTIFNNVAEGLATSQKEKLQTLAESVEFESEESYRGKIETLKESYFGSKKHQLPQRPHLKNSRKKQNIQSQQLDLWQKYLDALGRMK